MEFKFYNKDQEDSFLKTRIESLFLSQNIKNTLLEKGMRTVRSFVYQSNKELDKITGSSENSTLLISSLDRLALEIRYAEKYNLSLLSEDRHLDTKEPQSLFLPESVLDKKDDIIGAFSEYFGIDRKLILSKSRKHNLVYIRNLIAYVLREYSDMSFLAIGELLGGRDHTTIIHSYRKLKETFKNDEKLHLGLNDLIERAKSLKEIKDPIEEELLPDLISLINEKQAEQKKPLKLILISERDIEVIKLYKEGVTFEEIGKTIGVTRERVRQIVERTIRKTAFNESILKGIEFDVEVILEEEKKKRLQIKNKGKVLQPKKVKERTWSRYYLACKACGMTSSPHRRKGLCQLCVGQYWGENREKIILKHNNVCDRCYVNRADAKLEYRRDFYITKDQQVLCRKCFLLSAGAMLGEKRKEKYKIR
jgi:hypothetical protein